MTDTDDATVDELRMYIGGDWERSQGGTTYTTDNPATGEPLATLQKGTREDASRAVEAANEVQSDLAAMTAFERGDLCLEIADAIEDRQDWLAEWIVRDQGKPLHQAHHELVDSIENFRNAGEYVKHATTEVLNSRDPNKQVVMVRKPRGVYGIITPWNFPVGNPTEHLAAALAVGNAVVWVSAPSTSAVAVKLMEILAGTDLPDGALNHVTGEGPVVGNEVVVNDGVDAIGFTGSTSTGKAIAADAPGKHVLLELGGNGPIVVLDDADLDAAVEGTALSCFYNAGQVCTASERILVHEDVHEEFVDRLVGWAESMTVGDPMADDTDMGPLNNEAVAVKMDHHVENAREHGAAIAAGGERLPEVGSSLYYEPTVIDGVTEEMVVSSEETFGPIAPVTTFSSYEEALSTANEDAYGLTSAVFTSNVKSMRYFAEGIEAGTVIVNDGSGYWENQLPMGGYSGKESGYGRRGGKHTIEEMSQLKTIVTDFENVRNDHL